MMTNLFSIFDPISSILFNFNWISLIFGLLIIPFSYWIIPSRILIMKMIMFYTLHKEMKLLMGGSYFLGSTMIFICLFTLIMYNNVFGLLPYMFTSTTHMAITLSLSFPLWVSYMMFGWINKSTHMFTHLVPQGTPTLLMSFMVLIESVSNVIRPLTLAVRLAANMVAGHLLLSLLGNQGIMSSYLILFLILFSQILLVILESAVALIQSYVFMILSTLYSSEVY
uniref:ATP synthase subunit a n=1 Tax=Opisthopatus cinctipes TaxID=574546 RepID=D7QYT8_9BILA|nr:ATP synthase F0 subunit 6 [Opisthopatus cinctipes]ADE05868.1 ATP synthase F0 subunit 6 [Opisthopatus cinctipes]